MKSRTFNSRRPTNNTPNRIRRSPRDGVFIGFYANPLSYKVLQNPTPSEHNGSADGGIVGGLADKACQAPQRGGFFSRRMLK